MLDDDIHENSFDRIQLPLHSISFLVQSCGDFPWQDVNTSDLKRRGEARCETFSEL